MDVIEYKLATNNSVLISHGLWKLLETIQQKVEDGEHESKIKDSKYLFSQCQSNNGVISITACQAVVALAERGVLEVSGAITNLTACLVAAKHCGAVASAICSLLSMELKRKFETETHYVSPFNLKSPQHPLITVLELKKEAWRDVLNHIRTMMKHCRAELMEQHVILFRPVFLHILCNPSPSVSESCRQNAWNLLMRTEGTVDLQIEVLQWLRTKNVESCIDTNSRIIELAEVADAFEYEELCSALIPMITSMALELLRQGGDPRANLDTVSAILNFEDTDAGCVIILMLAEMMLITPSIYLLDIVYVASAIVQNVSWNKIVGHTLIAALVRWMSYPSILTSEALDIGEKLIKTILNAPVKNTETDKLYTFEPLEKLWYSDANVQFYTELCICVESLDRENILLWLERISKVPVYVMTNYKMIISAIFLESTETAVVLKTCEMLVQIASTDAQILSLILYKLANTRDIEQTKVLLLTLPKLTGVKENVPIVMNTLKILSNATEPLNYLALQLYVDTLAFEPRCYRYAQEALINLHSSDRSFRKDVTCARAMQRICEKYSERGAELVPLLSQTLNRCYDRNGGIASALVINGISALCVDGITEITSTWKVLKPMMNKEKRSIVIIALCKFFGVVPKTPSAQDMTQDFSDFLIEILTKLWDLALTSQEVGIIEASFEALRAYKLETMPLRVLPTEFRNYVELPALTSLEDVGTSDKTTDDNLPYIPASYWIEILKNIHPIAYTAIGKFFQHFIQEELYNFRSGIYRWPHGEPANFNYLSEKSPLRAIGEHIRHYKPSKDIDKQRIVVECLKIFAHKYSKPLPPIKWQGFNMAIEISSQSRKYGIIVACHQAPTSPSAKEYLEKHLISVTKEWTGTSQQLEECSDMYEKLDDVCRAVGSNVLGPYLEITLNSILEKTKLDRDDTVGMFNEVMKCFTKGLKDELIHNDNRSLLTSILEKLMDRIDNDSKIFQSYIDATMELSTEQIERMTLPSVWLDITPEKLRKAIKIRATLVLNKKVDVPLTWMNEIIRATASSVAVHDCLLEQMQIILPEMRLEKTNANWTLDLMRWIGSVVADAKESINIEKASFFCEVLFIAIICLSSRDCLLLNDSVLVSSNAVRAKLFPQALACIIQTAHWKNISSQTMEWLNHMKYSKIPGEYKIVFHNALVSLKNENHFDVMWTKYLSTKPAK